MDSKLGETFFDTRARLGSAIFALSRLAAELEVHPSRVTLLKNLIANLKEPFLFVVAGEVNAGKSTLLNALFGEEFCKADVLPMTDKICLFKHGPDARDIAVSDTFQELYRPNDFLKDFNIVDTPGTNSIVGEHQEITERFIPLADLVIFTFSVTNPWGATAWALLDHIHKRWFKNVVFVLQQCDLRNPDEISAIVEHIRVTSLQRLGTQFPIFALSAKQAFLAKTSGLDKDRLFASSGFAGFERFISEVIDSSEVRQLKLGNVSRSARVVLKEASDKLSSGATILRADEELLGGLDADAENQRVRTLEKFSALFRSLDSEYMELSIAGSAYLQNQLGFRPTLVSLFKGNHAPEVIQRRIIDSMVTAAEEQVGEASGIVEDDLQHLWRQLADTMQEHFNFKMRVGTESGQPEWDKQTAHMRSRLVTTLKQRLPKLELAKELRGRMAIRRWLTGIFVFGSAAAVIGGLVGWIGGALTSNQVVFSGALMLAGVLAAIICGSIAMHRNMTGIVNALGDHLERNRADLGGALKENLTEEVNGFFADFVSLFAPLRQLCDEHRARYTPQLQEIRDIEKAFDEVDALIGVSPEPPGAGRED